MKLAVISNYCCEIDSFTISNKNQEIEEEGAGEKKT